MDNKYKLAVLYGKFHCTNNKICELIKQINEIIEEIGRLEAETNKPTSKETKILGVGSGWEPEININDIYEE